MFDIDYNDIFNADFKLFESNPIVRNFGGSFVAADPSVLTPDHSHDRRWHLFCHTFFGVYEMSGDDGIKFGRPKKIVPRAMRPNINYKDGKYYLFYERTRSLASNAASLLGGKWQSSVYIVKSDDLAKWSAPEEALAFSRDFEQCGKGHSLSNPFYFDDEGVNRLYYSCGLTFIDDCGFSEPTYINYAESKSIDGRYVSRCEPILVPDADNPHMNLCCGCVKVYKLRDCYIGLQNGIYRSEDGSHSAIMLLRSDDGINFEFGKVLLAPKSLPDSQWMAGYVYACCLVFYRGELRLYFNARNTAAALSGRESIGFARALIK